MKSTCSAIALAAMFTAAAAAGGSQDRIPELQREASKDSATETLTGCVARSTAGDTYVLADVTNDRRDDKTTPTGIFERTSVALSATDVDVSKHVGHRVSVTGWYVSPDLFAPRAETGEKRSDAQPISQTDKRAKRTFRITSVSMLSDSCSRGAD